MLMPLMKMCCRVVRNKLLVHGQRNTSVLASVTSQSSYIQKLRLIQNLKDNNEKCDEIMQKARFTLFYELRPLVAENPDGGHYIPWKRYNEMSTILNDRQPVVLTTFVDDGNSDQDALTFAVNIPKGCKHEGSLQNDVNGFTTSMKTAIFTMPQEDVNVLSQGFGLLEWHLKNSFCPNCGSKTIPDVVGSKRLCQQCTQVTYPKMAPIIITLVTDDDKCLVVRQPLFPKGMFSALAGFCEIGETIEMTTRREVAEEVGLEVEHIQYHGSQHWPFPSSGLMLGCYATVKPGTAHKMWLDTKELEDACWLTRKEIHLALAANDMSKGERSSLWLPPPPAIARGLLENWAAASNV